MHGKTVIITGANAGIGKAAALDLLRRGAKVIFAGRNEERNMAVINAIANPSEKANAIFIKLDLSSFASITHFVQQVKSDIGKIDVLINNGGGLFDTFKKSENIENSIGTNHVGHVILSAMLIDNLNYEGRIINVSSQGHEFITQKVFDDFIADPTFEKTESKYEYFPSYCFSKIGNVIHAEHLNSFFYKNNITAKAVSLHPGAVATDFANRLTNKTLQTIAKLSYPIQQTALKTSLEGAQTIIHTAIMDYQQLEGGAYYNNLEVQTSNPVASNPENIKKMMEYTRTLIERNMNDIPKEVIKYLSSI